MDKIKLYNQKNLKNIPEINSGMKVRVSQRIKEGDKERLQAFEGVVIAVKHGKGKSGTFTVRKISSGVGVERVFPFHAPTVEKVEVLSQAKVRRAKIYYLRSRTGKKARMKKVELAEAVVPEPIVEVSEAPESETPKIKEDSLITE